MNLAKVKKILEDHFNEQPSRGARRNIIFWYDEEGQFAHDMERMELTNARILFLQPNNSFQIKYQLEKADPESNYLIYSPLPKPPGRENWLLDIEKYSAGFSTDKAILIMRDFGVKEPAMVNLFRRYLKFFENRERYKKLASYELDLSTEDRMHTAVMSALCRLPVADLDHVVRKVLSGETEEENRYFKEIESFGDINAFWELVRKRYGYSGEKLLGKLLLMFLVTHLSFSLKEKLPGTWEQFLTEKRTDSVIFLDGFMNHSGDSKFYDLLSCRAEEVLKVKDYLPKWDLEKYWDCDTFRAIELAIISFIRDNLLEDIGEFSRYQSIIDRRRTSHWFEEFEDEYGALYYASKLLETEKKLGGIIRAETVSEMMTKYTKDYFWLDLCYRKFYLHYDHTEKKETLTPLAEKIENCYVHWFLDELSTKWSEALANHLPKGYLIPGIDRQQEFYAGHISGHIKREERVFVIISDGLRYEVGRELQGLLQKELRGIAQLSFMQGVVPSTTKFGMTSLLPGRNIEISGQADMLKDGISTQGTENREKILEKFSDQAIAIRHQDMLEMKRVDYKETFEGSRLIYIYHNAIDAVGDDSITEREVFQAAEKTLQELLRLVRNLINNISATNIYITADHGFIYRRSPLVESDKVSKGELEVIEAGRRYALTAAETESESALVIPMDYLLDKESSLKTIVPKGVIRYKVQGPGINYVHGGASLQEIVIPLIKFKYLRKDDYKPTKVRVQLTNISRKITNRITYLEFLQTDKVGDKKLPLKLKLYFTDEKGERISNENIIIADSRSEYLQERNFREKFTLKEMAYDRGKKYFLIMEDEEEPVEKIYEKIPIVIDLLFNDDFTF